MNTKNLYKDYVKIVKQELKIKRKLHKANISLYDDLENLSICQKCSNFKERLQYEIYKSEYTKIHNKKIGVKQELQNAIKQSLKKLISKGR